jgi:DNA sulfur modification protein DndD
MRESSIVETLTIRENGIALDLSQGELATHLAEMFPPALAAVCLFDGERLDLMSDPEGLRTLLKDGLDRVLGLDVVSRLQSDLEYLTLQRGSSRQIEKLRDEVLKHQAAADTLSARLADLQGEVDTLNEEERELRRQLATAESELLAEGGGFAARRPLLQARLEALDKEAAEFEEELRVLTGELLPFALAPELCRTFVKRLDDEARARRLRIVDEVWDERVSAIELDIGALPDWDTLGISARARETIQRAVLKALREPRSGSADSSPLHDLADADHERVRANVVRVLSDVPEQISKLGERLKALAAEKNAIGRELKRAPDDAVLARLHARISEITVSLQGLTPRRRALDDRGAALRNERQLHERQRDSASTKFVQAQSSERQVRLAEAARLALKRYEDALTEKQVARLELGIAHEFNRACQKDRLLASVRIATDKFDVDLIGADGQSIRIQDLSAGERQLFALAAMRALRDISGRQLPLILDTPVARLDHEHRIRLLRDFLPSAAEQVVLFATTAEIDDETMPALAPSIARAFRLRYDNDGGHSVWEREYHVPRMLVALSA